AVPRRRRAPAVLLPDRGGAVVRLAPLLLGLVRRPLHGRRQFLSSWHDSPQDGPPRAPACSRPAARAATAMMVRAGLALPWVGSTLPSVMYRLGTAKLRQVPSTTPCRSSAAIRAPPTRCANRWMVITSSAPAACRMS